MQKYPSIPCTKYIIILTILKVAYSLFNILQTCCMFLTQIVSCSGDGIIAYNDVERTDVHGRFLFNCHYGTAYEVSMLYLYYNVQAWHFETLMAQS